MALEIRIIEDRKREREKERECGRETRTKVEGGGLSNGPQDLVCKVFSTVLYYDVKRVRDREVWLKV